MKCALRGIRVIRDARRAPTCNDTRVMGHVPPLHSAHPPVTLVCGDWRRRRSRARGTRGQRIAHIGAHVCGARDASQSYHIARRAPTREIALLAPCGLCKHSATHACLQPVSLKAHIACARSEQPRRRSRPQVAACLPRRGCVAFPAFFHDFCSVAHALKPCLPASMHTQQALRQTAHPYNEIGVPTSTSKRHLPDRHAPPCPWCKRGSSNAHQMLITTTLQ